MLKDTLCGCRADMADHVDHVLAQWRAERPDLDVSPMGQARGLVVCTRCEQDGRGLDVTLTPDGRKVVEAALPDHVDNEHRPLASLGAEQREQLAAILSTHHGSGRGIAQR